MDSFGFGFVEFIHNFLEVGLGSFAEFSDVVEEAFTKNHAIFEVFVSWD